MATGQQPHDSTNVDESNDKLPLSPRQRVVASLIGALFGAAVTGYLFYRLGIIQAIIGGIVGSFIGGLVFGNWWNFLGEE